MTQKNQNPYWTAGTLEGKAYIERDADQRLRKELSDNQRFVFLFGPRHSGTSSLATHCMDSLSPGQYCCTRVDLSKLPHDDYHTMIGALLETIANDTALDKQEILTEFPEDTILAWLRTFPQRLILFLDEVQTIGRLPFRDQLFGKLRFLYNVRVENEQFSRLQVVLSGAAHPERLIPVNLAMPFVGGAIAVPQLNQKQVEKLTWDLESAGVQIDGQVASLLYAQTSGIVHLCQLVLAELWEQAERTRVNVGTADVERVIEQLITSSEKINHFVTIYAGVTEDAARLGAFLRLVKGDPIDPGLLQDLMLTGLCDPERPYLCPIYERVFGPNGPLDLGLAQKVHTQVTSQHAIISIPSAVTPEVYTEPPPEAHRDHSLVTRLPLPPSGVTPSLDALPEPPLVPRPLPGVATIAPPAVDAAVPELLDSAGDTSIELSIEPAAEPAIDSAIDSAGDAPAEELSEPPPAGSGMSSDALAALPDPPAPNSPRTPIPHSRITPLVQDPIEPPPIELRSAELQPVDLNTLAEPPPPGSESSEEILEIDQTQEEDPTWVEDPVAEMKSQLARQKHKSASPSDAKVVQMRAKLDAKLMLSAELDSFCASFFPHVAQKFIPGMSRSEKTDLLLSLVATTEISKRLREWSSRIELNQEVISQVTTRPAPGMTSPEGSGRSSKSPARAAEAPPPSVPIEDSATFKPPGVLQVGVGLVLANRYFLTSEVGQGPVAVVWSAYDRIKDEQVALKLINGQSAEKPAVLEVFWRSAQQMAALSHPAIVGVLNKPREENEVHYVVLEFLPGGNLRQWVQGGKLSRGQILRVLQRLGAGLQYAHERRVLHRNIKPTNILFDSTGHARLTDFNLVWPGEVAAGSEARTDRLMYMAPEEQLGGGSGDPRADVYSLGMCALYAIYGKDLPSRVVQDRTSFIEHLDCTASLKAVLKRATAASPFDRFATAAEFCRALEFDGPALPGISLRNSMPMAIIQVKSERSGPEPSSSSMPQSSRSLPPQSSLSAPPLSMNHHAAPPPIPHAPHAAPPPPLPAAQVMPPPPLPVFAPQELVVSAGPPLPAYDARRGDRDSEEIPPLPGRNPQTMGEYRVETERMRALAAAAALRASQPDPTPIMPPQRRQIGWTPFIFAGIAMLAVAGGSIGYFIGAQKANSTVDNGHGPVALNTGNNNGQPPPISRPLRVESLLPPPENPAPATAPKTTGDDSALAKNGPDKAAKEPTKDLAKDPGLGKKPALPTVVAMTSAAKNPPAKPTAGPNAKPGTPGPATETASKPTVVAMAPAGKPIKPVTPPQKPVVAANPPPVAASKPTLLALAPIKAKGKADTSAPHTQPKIAEPVRPVQHPIQNKPAVAATRPKYTPPPPRPVTPVQRPSAPPPTQSSTPEGEAAIQAAQSAFVRGQHQQAIAMAMQVTTRGGADALKAWRFVGSAACSVRSSQLATNAYNHLRDPDHKRLLLELCRRNGLQWNGSSFAGADD